MDAADGLSAAQGHDLFDHARWTVEQAFAITTGAAALVVAAASVVVLRSGPRPRWR